MHQWLSGPFLRESTPTLIASIVVSLSTFLQKQIMGFSTIRTFLKISEIKPSPDNSPGAHIFYKTGICLKVSERVSKACLQTKIMIEVI